MGHARRQHRAAGSFDDVSKSQPTAQHQQRHADCQMSVSVSEALPPTFMMTAADCEELRQRVTEARQRTKELVSKYLAVSARSNAVLAQHREAAAAREEARTALSASITHYAVLLRSLGEPPERTLVLIKSAFSEAAPRQDDDNRAALEDVVKWIVEAYYAA